MELCPNPSSGEGIRRVADVCSSLLSPLPSLLSSEAGRHSPISRRSVVRIARPWRCIPEDAEHSVGDLRGIFRSHIFHPVRMVSGAAASVPTRFVERRHHLHRQAAGEVAGRADPPSYRRYRYATRSRSNRRRHVGEWPTFALYWYAPRATAELSIQSSPGRRTFICSRANCERAWNGGWRRAHGREGTYGRNGWTTGSSGDGISFFRS